MIHVIAIITALPGQRARLLDAIRANIPAVLAEEGCIEYGAAVDAADPAAPWSSFGPDTVVIIEKWRGREHLRQHAAAAHMAAYALAVKDIVAARAIDVLEVAN